MNNKKIIFFLTFPVIIMFYYQEIRPQNKSAQTYYSYDGFCVCCENNVMFSSKNSWFRDNYKCPKCYSIPRERALIFTLKKLFPNYNNLSVYEIGPNKSGSSLALKQKCLNYTFSQYIDGKTSGEYLPEYQCTHQDLNKTSFNNETFDLIVSQEILEHVFRIENVLQEIERILKPGGSHIFTTPLVNKNKPTEIRAHLENGKLIYDKDPIYHGTFLVTYDLGYDIVKYVPNNCYVQIFYIENKDLGLENTECNEVCVMTKYK